MRAIRGLSGFLAASMVLSGCAGMPGSDPATDDAMNRCVKFYFKPGTPAMARCVEREAKSGRVGRGDSGEADRAYVRCIGYGYRPGSDKVARCVQREVNEPGSDRAKDDDE